MSRISNVVIRVRRMIKVDNVGKNEQQVDNVGKNEQIFKCCDQSAQNDQSGQGGKE